MENMPQQKNICLVAENRLRIEEGVWRKEDAGFQLSWDFAVCTGLQFCAVLNDYAQVGICGCEGDADKAISTANLIDDISTRHESAEPRNLTSTTIALPSWSQEKPFTTWLTSCGPPLVINAMYFP